MTVIALTIFVGLLLVVFFGLMWFAAAFDPRSFNERDALLPLDPDSPATRPSCPSRKSDS